MVALCVVLMGTMLVGCENKVGQIGSDLLSNITGKKDDNVLFEYDGQKVTMDEAWVYAKTIQSQYEAWYGSSVWDYEVNDENGQKVTMEEVTKKDLINQIKTVKYLSKAAKEQGITLTSDEETEIQTNAKDFMSSIAEADLKQTGITEETMIKVYEENKLASKYHDKIVEEANLTVSDEEARQFKTYNLLFETFEYDENGQKVEYSAKKKAQQKKKAEEALKRIQNGETNLAKLAKEYKADKSSEYTCGDDESTVKEYRDAAKVLKKGEISGIVESEFGYHIIKMINPNDKEATEEKKSELLQEKQTEYFNEKYKEMTKSLEEAWNFDKDVNQKLFDTITFKQAAESTTATEESASETVTESTVETTTEASTSVKK